MFYQMLCSCSKWSSSRPKTSSVSGTEATGGRKRRETTSGCDSAGRGSVGSSSCPLTTMVKTKPLLKSATGSPMASLMAMDMGQTPQSAGQLRQFSSSSHTSSPHTEARRFSNTDGSRSHRFRHVTISERRRRERRFTDLGRWRRAL